MLLVPKLLSPIDDIEEYVQFNYEGWFGLMNTFLSFIPGNMLVSSLLLLLCGVRYISILTVMNHGVNLLPVKAISPIICLAGPAILAGYWIWGTEKYGDSGFAFVRITQSAFPADQDWMLGSNDFLHTCFGVYIFMVLLSVIFSALNAQYLMKSFGRTPSEAANRNLRKSVVSILVMNVFSTFLVSLNTCWLYYQIKHKNYITFPKYLDVLRFTTIYGFPLTQAAFNAISFIVISSSFQKFVRNLGPVNKIWPVTPSGNQRPPHQPA